MTSWWNWWTECPLNPNILFPKPEPSYTSIKIAKNIFMFARPVVLALAILIFRNRKKEKMQGQA